MDSNSNLTKEVVERYCRQIILPEIGRDGQIKIMNSKVLVIGAGGLGSPCLMYLAGAGIGEIGIVDGDSVDVSNLHRQIIHMSSNKGIKKCQSAKMLINSFNPDIKVNTYEEHLNIKNALAICEKYEVLVDCTDNPATRYLINDVAVILNKPVVSGSAIQWDGQLTVYHKSSIDTINDKLPCYRCLFPIPTPSSAVCNCSDAGVFGPTPGVIGTLQANEVVKLILGYKENILSKRMLIYDGLNMTFRLIKLRNNKDDCVVCGINPKININNIEEYDYKEFVDPKECRIDMRIPVPEQNDITWKEYIEKRTPDSVLIDVRVIEQFNMFNIPETINVPYKKFVNDLDILKKDILSKNKDIYIMCRAGNLSTHAVNHLLKNGYDRVYNLKEGIHGYIKEIDNNAPFY